MRIGRLDPALGAALVGAAALRVVGLGTQSFWYDELSTRTVVSGSFGDVIPRVAELEGSPPLYFMGMWGWAKAFGHGPVALRSLSVVAGVATVALMYALVLELGLGRRSARVAAVLAAVSPMLVWYSQEARSYALLVALVAASGLWFVRCLHDGRPLDRVLWLLLSLAAVGTHYFAAAFVIPEAIWLLVARPRERRVQLAATVPLVALIVCFVPFARHQEAKGFQRWIDDWSLSFRLGEAQEHLLMGPASPVGWYWKAVEVVLLGALVAALVQADRSRRMVALGAAAVALVVGLGPALGGVVGADFFLDRNVMVVLVPLIVVMAAGLGTGRPIVPVLAVALVAAVSVHTVVDVATEPGMQRADVAALAEVLDERPDGSLLFVDGNTMGVALQHYLDGIRRLAPAERVPVREIDVVALGPDGADYGASCSWWFGRACVLILSPTTLPADLADRFEPVGVRSAGQLQVVRYRAREPVLLGPPDLPGGLSFVPT